jgi:hypothetical protein
MMRLHQLVVLVPGLVTIIAPAVSVLSMLLPNHWDAYEAPHNRRHGRRYDQRQGRGCEGRNHVTLRRKSHA